MSTANFITQDDFPLYVLDMLDDEDEVKEEGYFDIRDYYDIIIEDLEAELEHVNNELYHQGVDDYEIVLKDGYYSDIQLYVDGEFDNSGYKCYELEEEGLSEREIADELERMAQEEISLVNKALAKFAKEQGFVRIRETGRFSNGEAIYEPVLSNKIRNKNSVLSYIYEPGYREPDLNPPDEKWYGEYDELDDVPSYELDDEDLQERYIDCRDEEDWDEIVFRINNNNKHPHLSFENVLGDRFDELSNEAEDINDYSQFEYWELRDCLLPWCKEELEHRIKNGYDSKIAEANLKQIQTLMKRKNPKKKLVKANVVKANKINKEIIRIINKFEKEGPNSILSQSVRTDNMKNDYFKVKNLYEKVQDTMDKNGYELSEEEIQDITNQLLDTFEDDVRFQKLNKVVDNMNDFLCSVVTILGCGMGFSAICSNIVNQIHLHCGISFGVSWLFGLAIAILSLALKIISSYLTKKKVLKNMW